MKTTLALILAFSSFQAFAWTYNQPQYGQQPQYGYQPPPVVPVVPVAPVPRNDAPVTFNNVRTPDGRNINCTTLNISPSYSSTNCY